jgi:hypothetical protein
MHKSCRHGYLYKTRIVLRITRSPQTVFASAAAHLHPPPPFTRRFHPHLAASARSGTAIVASHVDRPLRQGRRSGLLAVELSNQSLLRTTAAAPGRYLHGGMWGALTRDKPGQTPMEKTDRETDPTRRSNHFPSPYPIPSSPHMSLSACGESSNLAASPAKQLVLADTEDHFPPLASGPPLDPG